MTHPDPIELLHEGRFLRLVKQGRWEFVTRRTPNGAAVIIAITEAHELVLVEQFRVPVGAATIELPAGIIGDEDGFADESVLASARRELLEETGFTCQAAKVVLSGPTAAGLTAEMTHLVLATGLARVHGGGGVDGENITVHVVPLDALGPWLDAAQARGCLIEPKVFAAPYFIASAADQ
jgi:ADP-ribose pyrophosphatase